MKDVQVQRRIDRCNRGTRILTQHRVDQRIEHLDRERRRMRTTPQCIAMYTMSDMDVRKTGGGPVDVNMERLHISYEDPQAPEL